MNVLLINSGEDGKITARKAVTNYLPWMTDLLRRTSPILPRTLVRNTLSGFGTSEKRFPIGLGYLSSVMKGNGHTVKLIDRFCHGGKWVDNIHMFDFIGIYSSTPCFDDTLNVIETLKKERFKGKIALGGPHATAFPDTIPDSVDYIVQGEGEYVINDLVDGKFQSGVILRTQRIVDLDKLPRPDYELYDLKHDPYQLSFKYSSVTPVFNMNTSRSCPLICKFCSVKDIWGRIWRGQSAERVIDDICFLKSKYGVKGIYFREDYFLANKNRAIAICEELIRKKLEIEWACETRVDVASDEEFVKLLARSGCRGFYIGAESGSQRMLDLYEKKTTVEQIIKTCENAHKYGIRIAMSLIVAHPQETWSDRMGTFNLILKSKPEMIFASPYRDEFLRHGKNEFRRYTKREIKEITYENGTWDGQRDRQ